MSTFYDKFALRESKNSSNARSDVTAIDWIIYVSRKVWPHPLLWHSVLSS